MDEELNQILESLSLQELIELNNILLEFMSVDELQRNSITCMLNKF